MQLRELLNRVKDGNDLDKALKAITLARQRRASFGQHQPFSPQLGACLAKVVLLSDAKQSTDSHAGSFCLGVCGSTLYHHDPLQQQQFAIITHQHLASKQGVYWHCLLPCPSSHGVQMVNRSQSIRLGIHEDWHLPCCASHSVPAQSVCKVPSGCRCCAGFDSGGCSTFGGTNAEQGNCGRHPNLQCQLSSPCQTFWTWS